MKVQVSNTNTPNCRDKPYNFSNRSITLYGNRFKKTPFYSYNALVTKSSKK